MILVFKAPTRDAAWGMLTTRGVAYANIDVVKVNGSEWIVEVPDSYRPVASAWFAEELGHTLATPGFPMGTLLWFSDADAP